MAGLEAPWELTGEGKERRGGGRGLGGAVTGGAHGGGAARGGAMGCWCELSV
jgi:hypothetical protein